MRVDQNLLLRVGRVLDHLRCAFLGQNIPLTDALEQKYYFPITCAKELSAQLLFVMVNQNDWSDEEISAAERWLRAAIYYILRETGREEHTFRSLMKLTTTFPDILAFLDSSKFDRPTRPSYLTGQVMEYAILGLLESKRMLDGARRALDAAEKLLGGFDAV